MSVVFEVDARGVFGGALAGAFLCDGLPSSESEDRKRVVRRRLAGDGRARSSSSPAGAGAGARNGDATTGSSQISSRDIDIVPVTEVVPSGGNGDETVVVVGGNDPAV